MIRVEKNPEPLISLEDILVKEFRVYQVLFGLTKEEREALSKNDVQLLLALVERKEALLDELGQLHETRRMKMQAVADVLGLANPSPTLAEVLAALEPGAAGQLGHLRAGILALMHQIQEITQGNRALANTAIERADALQTFLLSLFQAPAGYGPQGAHPASEPPVSWEIDQIA